MYAAVMSLILVFPWSLVALTTIGRLRAQYARAAYVDRAARLGKSLLTAIVPHVTIKAVKRNS